MIDTKKAMRNTLKEKIILNKYLITYGLKGYYWMFKIDIYNPNSIFTNNILEFKILK